MAILLRNIEYQLLTRSYIDGWTPSFADVQIFISLNGSPGVEEYPSIDRWYRHFATFPESEYESLRQPSSKTVAEDLLSAPISSDTAAGYRIREDSKRNEEAQAKRDAAEKEAYLAAQAAKSGAAAPAKAAENDDEEVDMFGSDDEEQDAEAERIKAERLAAYHAKKALKPKVVAKSIVTLEVKPWDDETDMDALQASVLSIQKDGLVWGGSQRIAVGYGIFKLQINCVIEDEKISLDELQEDLAGFEDYIQSSDVIAMQKL